MNETQYRAEYAKEIATSWFELFSTFQETLGDYDPLTQTAKTEYIRWNMQYLALKESV